MRETQYDAIVIGAGHNGLVCASYLAQEGLSVLVLERLDRTGGAIVGETIHPGFTVPYCPYVCHMFQGKVIEELDLTRHGYATYPYDPMAFQPFPDGSYLMSWHDDRQTQDGIRRLSERDRQGFSGVERLLGARRRHPVPLFLHRAAYLCAGDGGRARHARRGSVGNHADGRRQ